MAGLSVLATQLAVTGCCMGPAGSCAPLSRQSFNDTKAKIDTQLATVADFASPGRLLHVGHKLGSYRDYPHRICRDGVAGGLTDQNVLMNTAFQANWALDGLELDLQPGPAENGDDPDLYVVHDPIEAGVPKERYQEKSIRRLLDAFRANRYAAANKHLYLELKAHRDCAGEKLATPYDEDQIADKVILFVRAYPDLVPAMAFTSFSARDLEVLHDKASAAHLPPLHYYLIVGTTSSTMGNLGCRLGSGNIPRFDTKAKILTADWLTGIWFGPKTLSDFSSTLGAINDHRRGLQPLRFMFNVYQEEWTKTFERFTKDPRRLQQLEGVIYDLYDRDEKPSLETIPVTNGCSYKKI